MKLPVPVFNYSYGNKATENSLDVFIDGEIVDAQTEQIMKAYFGDDTSISYKSFRNAIEEAKPKYLNIFVNSIGGHVGDALAMYDYLKEVQACGTLVNVYVRGITASSSTYFQLAVPRENRHATANSFGLIHNVSGGVYGDLRSVQSYVNMMEKMNKTVVNLYVSNTNLSHQRITDMMDAETLLTAQEMADYGFIGPNNIMAEASVKNNIDISSFKFKNSAIQNAITSFTISKNENMDLTKLNETIENGFKNMLEKLGLTNKKDDAGLQAAFKEFSDGITNSVKEAMPTDEAITEKVTNAVKDLLKDETFTSTISNAAQKQVDERLKDVVTNDSLTESIKNLQTTLIKQLGSGTNPEKVENTGRKNGVKNSRFGNVDWTAE